MNPDILEDERDYEAQPKPIDQPFRWWWVFAFAMALLICATVTVFGVVGFVSWLAHIL
jgi:hypothetical protein